MNQKMKSEVEVFFRKHKLIKYKKGQILVRPDDNLGKIFLEKTGYARVYKITDSGREISWPNLRPMWLYSVISALLEQENEYYVEAVNNLEAWVVPVADFKKFLEEKKELSKEIYKSLMEDLLQLSEKMEQLILAEAYTKVTILINELVKNFGEKKGNEIIINFNIPHRVLASITGLTRETVTLQILKMQKRKILENRKRNIVIKDIKKLMSESQI
ncbi:MAG: Crp/Fnr family transcriptional regulator [Candidatus Shapirobacteria bacterium]|nr:Crp/Fnr family transcriptional regulator [Candidatus Shapirobacteria bacterium]